MYHAILLLHVLGATIWTGGHLVLATRILPAALRERSALLILSFEKRYEAIGMPALALQVLTGLWLAHQLLPPGEWFALTSPVSRMVTLKLTLLGLTVLLALDARLRVIPRLTDDRVGTIAWHISAVTVMGILFVMAGVGIRMGGLF